MSLNLRLLLFLCLSPVTAVAATDTRDLRVLFPHESPIFVDTDRLVRLELPPEVLAACRADLSDLRIFDREEREVSFLVDSGLGSDERIEMTQQITPRLVNVSQQQADSETGPSVRTETFDLLMPDEEPVSASWDLLFETDQPHFVRRIRVISHDPDGTQSLLIEEESIFRIPDPPREKLRIGLPETESDQLTVILVGEDGFYLSPGLRLENTRSLSPRDHATVELEELRREQLDGRTVVELRRPRGLVPDVLLVSTTTGAFNRPIEVWDDGPGASDMPLAQKALYRVAAVTTVQDTELPLQPARGDRLRVIITDAESPPLQDLSFQAVIRRPALLFALPGAPSQEPAGTLRFGGGRAFRPHYDLVGLPPIDRSVEGETARIAERLYDPAQLRTARLGEIRPNAHFDPAPALTFAMRPGAEIDTRFFSHLRRVAAQPSAEGLCRLRLQPEDLAAARQDLADIRIVDSESRQWAYLLEPRAELVVEALPVTHRISEDGRTRYRFKLPNTPALIDQLTLDSSEPFFDRSFVLTADLDEESRQTVTIATGRLTRRIDDPRPVTLGFAEARIHGLELEIVDGDDAPLDIRGVTSRFPVPELFFAAPAGTYNMILGNPEAGFPRYELAQVRQVVLAVEALDAHPGPLVDNPDYRAGARLTSRKGLLQALLWTVVIAVAVFLTALTLRLAKQEGKNGPAERTD